MSTAFARQTKIANVVGRSNYISDSKRQEHIVLHSDENMKNSWQDYTRFEMQNQRSNIANNQAREIIIPLPHDLANDKVKLKEIIENYAEKTLGNHRDFEYAVHWNKNKTNLHAHILFSERERNNERQPKIYKRDMWYEKDTNKMAKANAPNAELRYKKGEVQKDKDGNIKYNEETFTKKNRYFKTLDFNEEIKKNYAEVMNKYGFQFRLFDKEREIAQQHVGNKAPQELKVQIKAHNREIQQINQYMNDEKMGVLDRKKMIHLYKKKIKELVMKMKDVFQLKEVSKDDDKKFQKEIDKAHKFYRQKKVRTR